MATLLLAHCDGANGSTTFPDAAGLCTITAAGGVAVTTSNPRFGTGAAAFDGKAGSHLAISGLAQRSGDLTEDFQVYFNNVSDTQVLFDYRNTGGPILYLTGGKLTYLSGGTSASGGLPTAGAYHHIELDRISGVNTVYLDGVSVFTVNDSTPWGTSPIIGESKDGGAVLNGSLDEYRSQNTSTNSANFTPPTAAYGSAPVQARRRPLMLLAN